MLNQNKITIPSVKHLLAAYNAFHGKPAIFDLKKFALYCNWARFDPRLAEIISIYILKNWSTLPSAALNFELLNTEWPQAFAVMSESIKAFVEKGLRKKYALWLASVLDGISKLDYQSFYIGVTFLSAQSIRLAAESPLKFYEKWGFYGNEHFIPTHKKKTLAPRTSFSKKIRLSKLNDFIKIKKRFFLHDYITYLGGNVTTRQAQRDLHECIHLVPTGNTSARMYRSIQTKRP